MSDRHNTLGLLASYITFKALYASNHYKNHYSILSEFIKYILVNYKLNVFTETDIKYKLSECFEFDLPVAVIKTAIRNIEGVKYLGNSKSYILDKQQFDIESFKTYNNESLDNTRDLYDDLLKYVKEQLPNENISGHILMQNFIDFLLDKHTVNKYSEYISKYILKNESNDRVQKQISEIREGSILYMGVSNDYRDTGSLKQPLTLYLDTEILFHIMGYNGAYFEELAKDFFRLVQTANRNKKLIQLKYFSVVKNEIDSFFSSAVKLLEKGHCKKIINTVMTKILNGCENKADVRVKQSDFYHKLKFSFGITEDNTDYYAEKYHDYNLEGYQFDAEDSEEVQDIEEALKFISHINKLRKGEKNKDTLSSGYLFISETRKVLEMSDRIASVEQCDDISKNEGNCGYAISMSKITNLLWCKLFVGFSQQEYPKNIDCVLKSKIILSGLVNKNVTTQYNTALEQYQNKEISDETIACRIMTLRECLVKPEEINKDNVDSLCIHDEVFTRVETMLVNSQQSIESLTKENSDNMARLKKEQEEKAILSQHLSDTQSANAAMKNTVDVQAKKLAENEKTIEEYESLPAVKAYKFCGKVKLFLKGIRKSMLIILGLLVIVYCIDAYCNDNTINMIALFIGLCSFVPLEVFKSFKGSYRAAFQEKDRDNRG